VVLILNTPRLEVGDRDLLLETIWVYAGHNVDFVDVYNGCWMQRMGIAAAYTFDKTHFQRFEGVRVVVPK